MTADRLTSGNSATTTPTASQVVEEIVGFLTLDVRLQPIARQNVLQFVYLELRREHSKREDQPETGLHIGKVVRRQPAGTLYEPSLVEAACLRHDKD